MTKKWIKDGEFYQEGSSVVIDGQRYFAPLTDEQMIAAGYVEYAGDALNVTEAHKAAVEAMDNIEDVENFDITEGYPDKLVFEKAI